MWKCKCNSSTLCAYMIQRRADEFGFHPVPGAQQYQDHRFDCGTFLGSVIRDHLTVFRCMLRFVFYFHANIPIQININNMDTSVRHLHLESVSYI